MTGELTEESQAAVSFRPRNKQTYSKEKFKLPEAISYFLFLCASLFREQEIKWQQVKDKLDSRQREDGSFYKRITKRITDNDL